MVSLLKWKLLKIFALLIVSILIVFLVLQTLYLFKTKNINLQNLIATEIEKNTELIDNKIIEQFGKSSQPTIKNPTDTQTIQELYQTEQDGNLKILEIPLNLDENSSLYPILSRQIPNYSQADNDIENLQSYSILFNTNNNKYLILNDLVSSLTVYQKDDNWKYLYLKKGNLYRADQDFDKEEIIPFDSIDQVYFEKIVVMDSASYWLIGRYYDKNTSTFSLFPDFVVNFDSLVSYNLRDFNVEIEKKDNYEAQKIGFFNSEITKSRKKSNSLLEAKINYSPLNNQKIILQTFYKSNQYWLLDKENQLPKLLENDLEKLGSINELISCNKKVCFILNYKDLKLYKISLTGEFKFEKVEIQNKQKLEFGEIQNSLAWTIKNPNLILKIEDNSLKIWLANSWVLIGKD